LILVFQLSYWANARCTIWWVYIIFCIKSLIFWNQWWQRRNRRWW